MPKEHKCGIYVIEQTGTGRYYIGSSVAIRNRWYQHRRELKSGLHHSRFLQNAWTKYGEAAFSFWILEECRPEELIAAEQRYLDAFKPAFNVCPTADSPSGVSKQRALLRTHCPHGHEYTSENTYYGNGHPNDKRCKACNAARVAAIYASETPERTAVRLAKNSDYYRANRDTRRAVQNAYAIRTREAKRAYDRDPVNRARKQERRRMKALQGIPYG